MKNITIQLKDDEELLFNRNDNTYSIVKTKVVENNEKKNN